MRNCYARDEAATMAEKRDKEMTHGQNSKLMKCRSAGGVYGGNATKQAKLQSEFEDVRNAAPPRSRTLSISRKDMNAMNAEPANMARRLVRTGLRAIGPPTQTDDHTDFLIMGKPCFVAANFHCLGLGTERKGKGDGDATTKTGEMPGERGGANTAKA